MIPKPNYTEQQLREFRDKFSKRKKTLLLVVIPVALFFSGLVWAGSENKIPPGILIQFEMYLKPIGACIVAAIGLFSWKIWRCPACEKYLGKGMKSYCPHCGVQLA